MDKYIVGFLIDYEMEKFILINQGDIKNQAGTNLKWDGVGGRIEPQLDGNYYLNEDLNHKLSKGSYAPMDHWKELGISKSKLSPRDFESPHAAMEREFLEATGLLIKKNRWHCFHIKEYKDTYKIYMFVAFGPIKELELCLPFKHGSNYEGEVKIHTLIDVLFDSYLYTFDLPYILTMIFREMRSGFFMQLDPERVNSLAQNP